MQMLIGKLLKNLSIMEEYLMTKKIALIVLVFVVAVAVIFTGCTAARRPNTTGQNNNTTGMRTSYGNNDRGYQGTDQSGSYDNYTKVGDQLGIRDWTNDYRTGLNDGRVGNNTGGFTPGVTGLTGTNTGNNTGYNTLYNTGNNNGNNTGNNTGNTDTRQADDIARACEQVQGVDNATAVVTGNTAYVGIDMETNIRNVNQSDIKREVANRVRATGNNINTVYVSAEPDFMNRLRNVGNGVRNGKGGNTFTTELNDMVQRITPARW
jgi:spore cortex protein